MAKRIAFITDSGSTVEACPAGNTYPTGAITIPENTSKQAGDVSFYEKDDVSDSFHTYGKADIYIGGVKVKTILYDPDAGCLDVGKVTATETDFAY